jgi:hypothetical protein
MPYLIETSNDLTRPEDRERVRPSHLAYLDEQMHLLLAAGARLSDDGLSPIGSFYILDVEDRAAAEAFIAVEPYNKAGILVAVKYSRWRKAIFNFARP